VLTLTRAVRVYACAQAQPELPVQEVVRAPQAESSAVGACLHTPGIEATARAVPGLRRVVPRGGGPVEVGGLLSPLSALLLPAACRAGSRHSNSLSDAWRLPMEP